MVVLTARNRAGRTNLELQAAAAAAANQTCTSNPTLPQGALAGPAPRTPAAPESAGNKQHWATRPVSKQQAPASQAHRRMRSQADMASSQAVRFSSTLQQRCTLAGLARRAAKRQGSKQLTGVRSLQEPAGPPAARPGGGHAGSCSAGERSTHSRLSAAHLMRCESGSGAAATSSVSTPSAKEVGW